MSDLSNRIKTGFLHSRAFLVNLHSRPDRLREAESDLNREGMAWELVPAIPAAKALRLHSYIRTGSCAQALRFRLLLRRALREGLPAVFFFEDDVVLADDTLERLGQLSLPEDWDVFYLGCCHVRPAQPHSPGLVRCRGATTTHAWAVNRPAMRRLLREFSPRTGKFRNEFIAIDQVLARLHGELKAYACFPNLAWQRESWSDLEGRLYSAFGLDGQQTIWTENLEEAAQQHLEDQFERMLAEGEQQKELPGRRFWLGALDCGSPLPLKDCRDAGGGDRGRITLPAHADSAPREYLQPVTAPRPAPVPSCFPLSPPQQLL